MECPYSICTKNRESTYSLHTVIPILPVIVIPHDIVISLPCEFCRASSTLSGNWSMSLLMIMIRIRREIRARVQRRGGGTGTDAWMSNEDCTGVRIGNWIVAVSRIHGTNGTRQWIHWFHTISIIIRWFETWLLYHRTSGTSVVMRKRQYRIASLSWFQAIHMGRARISVSICR